VSARGLVLSRGRFYYEAALQSEGCMQVGWIDASFSGDVAEGNGVGDDAHSWAFDGYRKLRWHEASQPWGRNWKVGDVVGAAVDFDAGELWFSLNGSWTDGMGLAFRFHPRCVGLGRAQPADPPARVVPRDFVLGLIPAASLNRTEKFTFNFGPALRHGPPPGWTGCRAVCEAFDAPALNARARAVSGSEVPPSVQEAWKECVVWRRWQAALTLHWGGQRGRLHGGGDGRRTGGPLLPRHATQGRGGGGDAAAGAGAAAGRGREQARGQRQQRRRRGQGVVEPGAVPVGGERLDAPGAGGGARAAAGARGRRGARGRHGGRVPHAAAAVRAHGRAGPAVRVARARGRAPRRARALPGRAGAGALRFGEAAAAAARGRRVAALVGRPPRALAARRVAARGGGKGGAWAAG
jgi:hypothetical protein